MVMTSMAPQFSTELAPGCLVSYRYAYLDMSNKASVIDPGPCCAVGLLLTSVDCSHLAQIAMILLSVQKRSVIAYVFVNDLTLIR